MNCILCEISAHQVPASFVYEGEHVFAVMTLEQPNPYKVIVCPRAHVETLYQLTDGQAALIFQTTVRIARAIRDASGCEGLNLVQSNGRAGQQDVFHFHLHLVPRFKGDSVRLEWPDTPADRATLDRLAGELRDRVRE